MERGRKVLLNKEEGGGIQMDYLMIPNSSKYPPRPFVPNGSLKVMTTLATLFLFQMGWRMALANLGKVTKE